MGYCYQNNFEHFFVNQTRCMPISLQNEKWYHGRLISTWIQINWTHLMIFECRIKFWAMPQNGVTRCPRRIRLCVRL